MANEITKCPMCGTKLKMIDGKMTCKQCGYYLRNDNGGQPDSAGQHYSTEQQQYNSQQYGTGQQQYNSQQYSTGQQQYNSQQYGTGQQQYNNNQQYSSGQHNSGQTNSTVAIVTAVTVSIACIVVFAVIILFRTGVFDGMLKSMKPSSNRESWEQEANSSESGAEPIVSDSAESPSQNKGNSATGTTSAKLPKSSFFRELAEAIWEKDYNTISAAEYDSLTALQINREEKSIHYCLYNGEVEELTYENDYGMDYADLSSFTGLEFLSIDDDLKQGDLDGLEYLYAVYAENTIDDLVKIIPHPEYIENLSISDTFLKRNLDGLENFPNLLYLYVEYDYLEDISALTNFPDLLGLALIDCDKVTDFSPLMTLTNMEELRIEADTLKSIDFVRNMPALTDLQIESEQLSNVNALEACPDLTYLALYLDDAYDVKDYSVIGQLTNLVDLTLEMDWGRNGVLPSFENLTQLQYLSLKNAGSLSALETVGNITYLSLENCSGWELESIASMQELRTLVINDFSSYVSSLEPLTRLPNLTALSLEETSIFGNIEDIFGIPTLQALYLNDCQVGLDFDNLPVNESLEILSLSDIRILKDPSYNNGDTVSISDHYDMFDCFPNLTELYAASLKIDSIDFVTKLPHLQYLDITDNNVTSLKPLESLDDFWVVWCGKNTILENVSEDSGIYVITED